MSQEEFATFQFPEHASTCDFARLDETFISDLEQCSAAKTLDEFQECRILKSGYLKRRKDDSSTESAGTNCAACDAIDIEYRKIYLWAQKWPGLSEPEYRRCRKIQKYGSRQLLYRRTYLSAEKYHVKSKTKRNPLVEVVTEPLKDRYLIYAADAKEKREEPNPKWSQWKNQSIEKIGYFLCCCRCMPLIAFLQSLFLLALGGIVFALALTVIASGGVVYRSYQWFFGYSKLNIVLRVLLFWLPLLPILIGIPVSMIAGLALSLSTSFVMPLWWMFKHDSLWSGWLTLKWQYREILPLVFSYSYGSRGDDITQKDPTKLDFAIIVLFAIPFWILPSTLFLFLIGGIPLFLSSFVLTFFAIPVLLLRYFWSQYGWNIRVAVIITGALPTAIIIAYPIVWIFFIGVALYSSFVKPFVLLFKHGEMKAPIRTWKWQIFTAIPGIFSRTWGEDAHNFVHANDEFEPYDKRLWKIPAVPMAMIFGPVIWLLALLGMFAVRSIPFYISHLDVVWHKSLQKFKAPVERDSRISDVFKRLGWMITFIPLTLWSIFALLMFPLGLVLIVIISPTFGMITFPLHLVAKGKPHREYKIFYKIDRFFSHRHFRRSSVCTHETALPLPSKVKEYFSPTEPVEV